MSSDSIWGNRRAAFKGAGRSGGFSGCFRVPRSRRAYVPAVHGKEREEREKENLSEDAVQDNMTVPGMDAAGGGMGADGTDKNKKKIRRLGKKKVFLVAALVAVFVGALGVTAVGEKNYFFRGWKGNVDDLIFNNARNKVEMSQLEEAYIRINEELDITMVKLGYVPSNLVLRDLIISQNRAVLQFEYNGVKYILYRERRINLPLL